MREKSSFPESLSEGIPVLTAKISYDFGQITVIGYFCFFCFYTVFPIIAD